MIVDASVVIDAVTDAGPRGRAARQAQALVIICAIRAEIALEVAEPTVAAWSQKAVRAWVEGLRASSSYLRILVAQSM